MAINVIVAGSGLTGGGSSSTVSLDIETGGIVNSMLAADAVLSGNIATGQVVKTLNGLTDSVTLAAGSHVTITPVGNTLTVATPIIGFTELDSVLPLTLSTPDSGVTIHGEINITPANDGGAVALQTGTAVFQTGFAALDNVFLPTTGGFAVGETSPTAFVHLKNDATNSKDYVKVFDKDDVNIFEIDKTGLTTIDSGIVTSSFILGVTDFVYGSALPEITFNKDTLFNETVTISKNVIGTTASVPLVDLVPHSATIPLFQTTADVASALVLKNVDNSAVVNTTLYSDGKFFSRQVKADNFVVGTLEQSAGAVTLGFSGPSLFACDASSAPITFTLPLIDASSPSGYQFTFKKTDVSTNAVMVSASGGQAIDGVTDKIMTTQWNALKIVSIVSGSSGYWLTI